MPQGKLVVATGIPVFDFELFIGGRLAYLSYASISLAKTEN